MGEERLIAGFSYLLGPFSIFLYYFERKRDLVYRHSFQAAMVGILSFSSILLARVFSFAGAITQENMFGEASQLFLSISFAVTSLSVLLFLLTLLGRDILFTKPPEDKDLLVSAVAYILGVSSVILYHVSNRGSSLRTHSLRATVLGAVILLARLFREAEQLFSGFLARDIFVLFTLLELTTSVIMLAVFLLLFLSSLNVRGEGMRATDPQ